MSIKDIMFAFSDATETENYKYVETVDRLMSVNANKIKIVTTARKNKYYGGNGND